MERWGGGHVSEGACAACRFQRKRCPPHCPLAPYFPSNRFNEFLNAQRLFGVANIIKLTKNLDPKSKTHAMESIIYESNARARDPVGGCLRICNHLRSQLSILRHEYALVLDYLHILRTQCNLIDNQPVAPPPPPLYDAIPVPFIQQQRQHLQHQDYDVGLDWTSFVKVNPDMENAITQNIGQLLFPFDENDRAPFQFFPNI